MQAIQTQYKGYRFRSRLEARWAVFFDALGIKFEYEPEGFVLKNGKRYLPDFYLPDVSLRRSSSSGIYIEIKPTAETASAAIEGFESALVAFAGLPPGNEADGGYELGPFCWDNYMSFMQCTRCGHVKIEYLESNYMICPHCGGEVVVASNSDEPFATASVNARSARFEHGESGLNPGR